LYVLFCLLIIVVSSKQIELHKEDKRLIEYIADVRNMYAQ